MDSNRTKGIDLHIHSAASDGSFTPSEILELAETLCLGAIAITDHDTIAGSKEALSIGSPASIQLITGVEISAKAPDSYRIPGSIHILGYDFDPDNLEVTLALEALRQARKVRIPRIVEKLTTLGLDISMDAVMGHVGDASAGRPHVAAELIRKGYASSINHAFDKYLSKGGPAYVDKYRIPVEKVINIIHNAGGLTVLAHPYLINMPRRELEVFIIDLKSMGLAGIEVLYPEHEAEFTSFLTHLAHKHDLLITGGTDFHGKIKPEIKMGTGRGDLFIPYTYYEKLINFRYEQSLSS